MQQINPTEGQRIDDRPLYVGLHRGVWPLYPNERRACNDNCNQGRACGCVPAIVDDEPADMTEGMGAFVLPFVFGLSLIAAALIVHFWRAA